MSHRTSVVVSRASQVHQMPQARRPQSGPGDEHDGAEDHAHLGPGQRPGVGDLRPGARLRRKARKPMEPASEMAKKRKATIAEGTW